MKKIFIALIASLITLSAQASTLIVAATPVPHAEILEFVKPILEKQGIDLEIKVFTDYVQPNIQVAEKHMDANFFQHQPYLDEFNQSRGSNLVSIVPVHLEPFGAYSEKFKNISDIPDGAKVAIPNDATNGGRALLLLEKAGLIKLKDNTNILATPKDIIKNPKHIEIRELEAATLPRVLNQLDLALINTNYALDAGLDPIQDALIMEDIKSPYANRLVARADNKDDPAVQALAKALNSPDVKQFILTQYKDAIIPAF